jgi:hypothetical protein
MKPSKTFFLCLLVIATLACNATFSFGYPTATAVTPLEATITSAPLLSNQVTLVSVPFIETNPGSATFPPYTITAQTPQLTGSDDPRVLAFNRRMGALVSTALDEYRGGFQTLPVTEFSNGSTLAMTYTAVATLGELWSFKFDFSFYADGAAHPGLNSLTVNYDLGQGRELKLSDLFLPGAAYLEPISVYCTEELQKQPFSDAFTLQGAAPTEQNYRNWNLTPDGLLITFDAYQVAPGAAGPQQVSVPFATLTAFIDPQGPLAGMGR